MLWGVESNVIERFGSAGIAKENISFSKDTFTFNAPYSPSELVNKFKNYYGPTMNAFEAAEKNGKALDLQHELEALFGFILFHFRIHKLKFINEFFTFFLPFQKIILTI